MGAVDGTLAIVCMGATFGVVALDNMGAMLTITHLLIHHLGLGQQENVEM
jgi:hypothetical protein